MISLGTALLALLACSLRRGNRKRRICEADIPVGNSGFSLRTDLFGFSRLARATGENKS